MLNILKFKKLIDVFLKLTSSEVSRLYTLFILLIINIVCEIITVISIPIFISVLISDNFLSNNSILGKLKNIFPEDNYLTLLSLFFIIFLIFSIFIRNVFLEYSTKFTFSTAKNLSYNIFKNIIYEPYILNVSRNSSDIIDLIIVKVNLVSYSFINPLVSLVSNAIMLMFILLTLALINMNITILILFLGSSFYIISWQFSKLLLKKNSNEINYASRKVVKLIQETRGHIRDITMDNSHSIYISKFLDKENRLRDAQSENIIISSKPKLYIEGALFISAILICIFLKVKLNNNEALFTIIGTFIFGAQKLIPLMQLVYGSWVSIISSKDAALEISEMIQHSSNNLITVNPLRTTFKKIIKFNNTSFKYPGSSKFALNDINVEILKGAIVGVNGNSGSGKSTFIDLLMGLLTPTAGSITVDNKVLDIHNIQAWRQNISHVPQSIFLADGSIFENIVLTDSALKVDATRLNLCCEIANINTFINSLPDGLNTIVGERGSKLSGGQRQRIGIARALYKNSEILILDEATNALDADTERNIITAIIKNFPNMTIFLVTHNKSLLEYCNQLLIIKSKKIYVIN